MGKGVAALQIIVVTLLSGAALAEGWTAMNPPEPPEPRWGQAMASCDAGAVVLFGGEANSGKRDDTWTYTYADDTWVLVHSGEGPPPRRSHDMAYDSESNVIVLFGGLGDNLVYGDTWVYHCDSGIWERMHPENHGSTPVARHSHAMAYCAECDRVILFGGCDGTGDFNDTWAYDYDHDIWIERHPENHGDIPGARRYHDMAYDSESDRVILFGGYQSGEPLEDTWAYDCNTGVWELKRPPNSPDPRWSHGMDYQAKIDRVLLFGGGIAHQLFHDTWLYDFNEDNWECYECDVCPGGRTACHSVAYDVENEQVILFGGSDGSALGDTWAWEPLYLDAPEGWLVQYWHWIAIPATPYRPAPEHVLGVDCGGILWNWDKYIKSAQVHRPPFTSFDLTVGESYLLWLDETPDPVSYPGTIPERPFEFKMGRMGWTWIGMPGLDELSGDEFMDTVMVKYPSDETGNYRYAREDWLSDEPWLSWGWSWWDPYAQAPRTFTPYSPWNNTCYPWLGYRVWVMVGTAANEESSDQVTLIWP